MKRQLKRWWSLSEKGNEGEKRQRQIKKQLEDVHSDTGDGDGTFPTPSSARVPGGGTSGSTVRRVRQVHTVPDSLKLHLVLDPRTWIPSFAVPSFLPVGLGPNTAAACQGWKKGCPAAAGSPGGRPLSPGSYSRGGGWRFHKSSACLLGRERVCVFRLRHAASPLLLPK